MYFSVAEKMGAVVLFLAGILFSFCPGCAVWLLSLFLLLCLSAPFVPWFGFYLPLVSRGTRGKRAVALTFDDGPSPASTPAVLDLLARHGLQATFFVVGEKAARHPELIEAILDHGHTIGNHSWKHDPLLMFRLSATLQEDIHRTQDVLASFGIRPLAFRPPAGVTNPRLGRVLAREGLFAVTYSCRAVDRGNRNIRNLAERILRRVRPGDIIVLHDLRPTGGQTTGYWLEELDRLFGALRRRYRIRPLAELIERPVMGTEAGGNRGGASRAVGGHCQENSALGPVAMPVLPTRGEVTDHGASKVLFLQPPDCNSSQVPRICAGAPVRSRPPMRTGATVQGRGACDELRGEWR